ncbi:MAG: O-antigen ligase family protein, partial [Lentisphaerae bacterium]|nr:O-antigen ligase family protein [Lentisphaerota bacterium]
YKGLSGRNTRLSLNLFISSVLCLISLYFLYSCHSKGAWLSLIAVCFIAFIVYLPGLKRRFLIRFAIYSMLLLILLVLFEGQALAGLLFNDVRFSLWFSTLRLCMDNPFLGVSCPSFESAYAQYRPIGYFLKSQYFAFRTTHPHNELLYILACFGIFGAVSWIVLWIYPLVKLFKIFKRLDTIAKLSLLSLSILVFHSMFDLILFQWPTIFIACILLGLLWRECWPTRKECNTGILPVELNATPCMPDLPPRKAGYLQKFLISLSFILSFTVFILFSYQDFRYSKNLRNSEIAFYSSGDPAKSLASLNAAIDYIPVPPSISHAGIVSSAVFKDNIMSLFYFDKLLKAPCPQIAHSNRHIAGALLKSGRKKEALDFLRRDTRNFPISVVSLYMEMSLENELGQKEEAEITAEKLYTALRHMGLTEKHIPAILENPYYENKFVELKNMVK